MEPAGSSCTLGLPIEISDSMKKLLPLILLLGLQGVAANDGTYLACVGHSGVASMQDQKPLYVRSITSNEEPVEGSILVGRDKIIVEGIFLMAGKYDVCAESAQITTFAPACYPGDPDKLNDSGTLNKVTGQVRYHGGEYLVILRCKKAAKLVE